MTLFFVGNITVLQPLVMERRRDGDLRRLGVLDGLRVLRLLLVAERRRLGHGLVDRRDGVRRSSPAASAAGAPAVRGFKPPNPRDGDLK